MQDVVSLLSCHHPHPDSNGKDQPVNGELAEVECLPGEVPGVLPRLLLLLLLLATLHEPEARQGDLEAKIILQTFFTLNSQLTLHPMLLPPKKNALFCLPTLRQSQSCQTPLLQDRVILAKMDVDTRPEKSQPTTAFHTKRGKLLSRLVDAR